MDFNAREVKSINAVVKEIVCFPTFGCKILIKNIETNDITKVKGLNKRDKIYIWFACLSQKKMLFGIKDILEWNGILKSLKEHKTPDKNRIWELLDEKSREIVEEWKEDKSIDENSKQLIINGFNEIIKNKDFYTNESFNYIKLSKGAEKLLSKEIDNLTKNEVKRLNRFLLESIYSQKIAKKRDYWFEIHKLLNDLLLDKNVIIRPDPFIPGKSGFLNAHVHTEDTKIYINEILVRRELVSVSNPMRGSKLCKKLEDIERKRR